MVSDALPTLPDVYRARRVIAPYLSPTPLRHYPGPLLSPLYGGGYAPLDCAATVFPPPRWCRWGSHRRVLRARAHRCPPCRRVGG